GSSSLSDSENWKTNWKQKTTFYRQGGPNFVEHTGPLFVDYGHQMRDVSQRTAAIVTGLGLLLMAVLAPFAYLHVLQNLIVPGDAVTTAANIMASRGPFRISIFLLLIVAILDVVAAWGFYVVLKPVNRSLSLLAAWFRILFAAVFAVALNNLLSVSELLSGSPYLGVFEPGQLSAQAMLFTKAFSNGWQIGLFIFGLHLLVLGYLIYKSSVFPRFLGILLVLASFGYMIDSIGILFIPGYHMAIASLTFVGEALIIFWLLWRGIKGFPPASA
ncbi:MAG: DUF4386 domain-containing protein, partial [Symbiobacteriia bacterium]